VKSSHAQVLRGRSDYRYPHMACATATAVDSIDTASPHWPARRCNALRVAPAAGQYIAVPLHQIDALRGDFGDWEELTLHEAQTRDPKCFEQFKQDTANWCPPNGEPYVAFRQRVHLGLQALCRLRTTHLLVFTHGGVIRALLADLLGLSPASAARFGVPLAGIVQLWIDDDNWSEPVRGSLLRLHWLGSPC
jgi:broad specificity phosphatase PhoE